MKNPKILRTAIEQLYLSFWPNISKNSRHDKLQRAKNMSVIHQNGCKIGDFFSPNSPFFLLYTYALNAIQPFEPVYIYVLYLSYS